MAQDGNSFSPLGPFRKRKKVERSPVSIELITAFESWLDDQKVSSESKNNAIQYLYIITAAAFANVAAKRLERGEYRTPTFQVKRFIRFAEDKASAKVIPNGVRTWLNKIKSELG